MSVIVEIDWAEDREGREVRGPVGPFATDEDANAWARDRIYNGEWNTSPLVAPPLMTEAEWSAAMDVEREVQIAHGYDDAHDTEHGPEHLLNWAIDYDRRGMSLAAATMTRCALRLIHPDGSTQ